MLTETDIRQIIREELFATSRQWWTLRAACELKGVSYDVVRKRPRRYWPNRGEGHPVIANGGHYSEMFSRDEVLAWLPLTEPEIDAQIVREVRRGG